mgnify:CR=1 FL=1
MKQSEEFKRKVKKKPDKNIVCKSLEVKYFRHKVFQLLY